VFTGKRSSVFTGFLFHVRSVVGLAGVMERTMGSTRKKKSREQSAAARRERAAEKRAEKSSVHSGDAGTVRVEMPAQIPEAALLSAAAGESSGGRRGPAAATTIPAP
jgi:hypothetical protein